MAPLLASPYGITFLGVSIHIMARQGQGKMWVVEG